MSEKPISPLRKTALSSIGDRTPGASRPAAASSSDVANG